MAQKPDGKASKTERVVFTRPAAERISKAVRIVEAGDRDATGLRFGKPGDSSAGKVFRVCTFTGAWSKDAAKVVTFRGVTSTPNTAVAQNIFVAISGTTSTSTTKNCAIAKDGTAWYLISAECS
jgi:hypothetical protein